MVNSYESLIFHKFKIKNLAKKLIKNMLILYVTGKKVNKV